MLLDQIDAKIEQKKLLKHPFYQAWNRGELSLECLKEYAIQYYHHVKAFPTYLSALHSHTDDAETRKKILENLVEEEGGNPNHPEMWKSFALRLGASEVEIDHTAPLRSMQEMIQAFRANCTHKSVADGLAALYAYESQIPDVSESKIDGLKCFYGLTHPKDWVYFTVHIEADKEHSAVERLLLSQHMNEHNADSVFETVDQTLDKLNGFLTELCMKYHISCAA